VLTFSVFVTRSRKGELSLFFVSARLGFWFFSPSRTRFRLGSARAFVSILALSLSLGLFLLTIFSFGLGWLSFVFSQLVVFRLHLLPVALVTTAFACYGVGFHFSFV
jgi:hypothetical protein